MADSDLTTEQVLKRDIPWETYMTAKLITGTGLQLLRRYDHKPRNVQDSLLEEDGVSYVKTFLSVLNNVTKEETMEYTLALIDDLLSENPSRARFFHDPALSGEDVYGILLKFLTKKKWILSQKKWYILETSAKILTLVLVSRPRTSHAPSSADLEAIHTTFIEWICNQIRDPSHETHSIRTAISALATLLRETSVRDLFVKANGLKLLSPLIAPATSHANTQLLYETVLSVWLLSFHPPAVEAVSGTRIVPRLVEVAKSSSKEKVVRVTILALYSLHKKDVLADHMVELGLHKIVQGLKLQAWGDEDLKTALDTLEFDLKAKIKVLSSFDKYKQEVLSGTLDWTPTHKDPAFWRENVSRFEENEFQILKVLVTLLDSSKDPKTLAVACFDIGQFIQNHQSGRLIALDLKARDRVMGLVEHPNPEVRKQALLCVQKLLLSAKYVSYLQ